MAATQIYTLSLHDALPILSGATIPRVDSDADDIASSHVFGLKRRDRHRSEEHTSELQSPYDIVCRLLLEKKNSMNCKIALIDRSPSSDKVRALNDRHLPVF